METVVFIGVGNMGAGMARNLLKAGYRLMVIDIDAAKVAALVAEGAQAIEDPALALQKADVVITMLPDAGYVNTVFEEQVFPWVRAQSLLIDCSTIDVATARTLGEKAAKKGCMMLDAPVSGGIGGAQAGTLAFMVGGEAAAFARAAPLFEIMGARHVHCGAAGMGQAAKICNNLMLAIQMISVAEGFTLAGKLGLDPAQLFAVSSAASAQCWSLTSYCPLPGIGPQTPADNDYKPGFAAALMLKDLRLAKQAAQSTDLVLPMFEQALARYADMVSVGEGGVDFSGIIRRTGTPA